MTGYTFAKLLISSKPKIAELKKMLKIAINGANDDEILELVYREALVFSRYMKTEKDVEALVKIRLKDYDFKFYVNGFVTPTGKLRIKKKPTSLSDRLMHEHTIAHENVHLRTHKNFVKLYGLLTKEFIENAYHPANWAKDEIRAYRAAKNFYRDFIRTVKKEL